MSNHNFDTVFVDESGDAGGSTGSSKYLILTLWCVEENKKISKILRLAKSKLYQTKKGARWLEKKGGAIKYYGFPDESLLKSTLRDLSATNSSIYYVAINKNGKKIPLKHKEFVLFDLFSYKNEFDNMPKKIIADKEYFSDKKIAFCILKKTNIKTEKDGHEIIHSSSTFRVLNREEYASLKNEDWDHVLKIEQQDTRKNDHLQALDLLSGAIYRYYEDGDDSLLGILNEGNIKVNKREII